MSVVCGSRHTLALSTEGVVLSWGDNSVGQLGHSTFNKLCYTPTKVTTLDGVPVIQVRYIWKEQLAPTAEQGVQ